MNLIWKLALLPTWSQPTPSPDEARQQAHHELSKVAYKPKQNILEKLFKWLDSTLSKAKLNLGLPEWVGVLLYGADSFAALLGHKNHFGTP